MGLKPKQCCVDCHFLAKDRRDYNYAKNYFNSLEKFVEISAIERDQARSEEYSWIQNEHDTTLVCAFGVFESLEHNNVIHQIIAQTDRRNFCFYWKYRPTLLISAAKILQEREAKNRDAARDRLLTRIALWIAVFALFINAVASFGNADVLKLLELFFGELGSGL